MKRCSVRGCHNLAEKRTWCSAHYSRWRKRGDVDANIPLRVRHNPVEQIRNKVAESDSGCWIWTGNLLPNGYGTVNFERRPQLAHRVSYTVFVGPIPDGLTIDHLCRNKSCVNPDHLEPVTRRENIRRAIEARRQSA